MMVSKTTTFKSENLEIVQGFMYKTKKNFSVTMNIIIEQWDEFSVAMMKLKEEQETKKGLDHIDEIKKAEPTYKHAKIKRVKK